MPPAEPTVFIVDDDAAVRDAIGLLLRSVGMSTRTFASAAEFLGAYDPAQPGCLILDIRMPQMSGVQLQEHLASTGAPVPIIFLTAHGDIPTAVRAMKAGAFDFLQKPFRDQELIDKVQSAVAADQRRRELAAQRDAVRRRLGSLTGREHDVLERVVAGKANKVIAAELGISRRTVELHRSRVMEKMAADSVSELVRMVLTAGGGPPGRHLASLPQNPMK